MEEEAGQLSFSSIQITNVQKIQIGIMDFIK